MRKQTGTAFNDILPWKEGLCSSRSGMDLMSIQGKHALDTRRGIAPTHRRRLSETEGAQDAGVAECRNGAPDMTEDPMQHRVEQVGKPPSPSEGDQAVDDAYPTPDPPRRIDIDFFMNMHDPLDSYRVEDFLHESPPVINPAATGADKALSIREPFTSVPSVARGGEGIANGANRARLRDDAAAEADWAAKAVNLYAQRERDLRDERDSLGVTATTAICTSPISNMQRNTRNLIDKATSNGADIRIRRQETLEINGDIFTKEICLSPIPVARRGPEACAFDADTTQQHGYDSHHGFQSISVMRAAFIPSECANAFSPQADAHDPRARGSYRPGTQGCETAVAGNAQMTRLHHVFDGEDGYEEEMFEDWMFEDELREGRGYAGVGDDDTMVRTMMGYFPNDFGGGMHTTGDGGTDAEHYRSAAPRMLQQQNMRFEREQGFAKHAPSDEMHPTRMRRMRGIIRDSKVPLIQTAMPRPDEFGLTICDTITGGDDDVFGNLAYVPQPPVPAWQPRAANNQFAACADNNDILEGSVEIHGPNDGARPAATHASKAAPARTTGRERTGASDEEESSHHADSGKLRATGAEARGAREIQEEGVSVGKRRTKRYVRAGCKQPGAAAAKSLAKAQIEQDVMSIQL